MEISLIADAVSVATTHVLGFSKFLIRNHQSFSSSSSPSNILSLVLPMDVLSPPRVRSHNHRSAPRTLVRRMHRTRRKSPTEEEGMDDGDKGIFDNGDGPFGGGGSGSGGRWWNYDPCGGSDWEESPSPSYSDPAFDFFYEAAQFKDMKGRDQVKNTKTRRQPYGKPSRTGPKTFSAMKRPQLVQPNLIPASSAPFLGQYEKFKSWLAHVNRNDANSLSIMVVLAK